MTVNTMPFDAVLEAAHEVVDVAGISVEVPRALAEAIDTLADKIIAYRRATGTWARTETRSFP